jgi:RNA polymerase sigma-70 factor (ECF subfamily)
MCLKHIFAFTNFSLMNEEAIIKGLAEKDENAFREMVKSFQKNVFHTCLGFVHNEKDAEDISQEVFIEVYRSIGKFRGDSKLSTWIYRIAVNKSLNYLRKHKHNRVMLSIDQMFKSPQEPEVQANFEEPGKSDHNFERKELSKVLEKAIHSLPKNQQIAFTFSKYDDMSYLQIAEIMDISLSAVESLIHRAKLNLQKKLLNYWKGKY